MNEPDQARLQRWLDGLLDGDELRVFEERLASDPELQVERDAQLALTASLCRSFAPAEIPLPMEPLPAEPLPAPRPAVPAISRPWPWFLLGAATSAAVFLCWALLTAPPSAPAHPVLADPAPAPSVDPLMAKEAELAAARQTLGRSWVALYAAGDEIAFRTADEDPTPPPMACVVGEQIPAFVRPLAPRQPVPFTWSDQPGVEFRRGLGTFGWEDRLRVLEFRALPATRILVFVLRSEDDPRPVPPDCDAPSLELFREARGPLVLYELTPLDRPRALPGLASGRGWVK